MYGEIIYNITLTKREAYVIKDLLEALDICPFCLNNDNYVEILREIANQRNNLDVEGLQISYEEEIKND